MQSNLIDSNPNIEQQQTGNTNNTSSSSQVDKWTNNLSKITRINSNLEEPLDNKTYSALDNRFHEIKSQTSQLGIHQANDILISNDHNDDISPNLTQMHANNNVEPSNKVTKPPMDKQIQPHTSSDNENHDRDGKVKTRKKSNKSPSKSPRPANKTNKNNANDNSFNYNKKKYMIELPIKNVKHSTETNNLLILIKIIIKIFINFILIFPVLIVLGLVLSVKYFFRLLFTLSHVCHISSTSQHSPHALTKFLSATELFWLYSSNLDHKSTNKNKNQEQTTNTVIKTVHRNIKQH
jgi:hypothetical protein